MRSLDNYQRYIKQREQATAAGSENGEVASNGTMPPLPPSAPVKKAAKASAAPAPAADAPNTRYVMRGGVTVPVVEENAAVIKVAEDAAPVPKPTRKPEPKMVTALDEVEEASVDVSHGEPVPLAASDAPVLPASLWERLPRHIQLLAQIPAPLEEEVAQKYYTRGFRESREELIERLLDPPLTLEDTARVLGVCPATVRRYTNRGVLLHQRTVGQQRRFRLSDVLLFLEKQQSKSAAVPARRTKKQA